ncbi:MAG: thioredoxin family protein [Victivallaceae bacterium]|nr:thioredoxin family protein [Victivallaceae bacterium]
MNGGNNGIIAKFKHVKSFLFIIAMASGVICLAQLKSPCACSGAVCAASTSTATPGNTFTEAQEKKTVKLPTMIELGAEKCVPCRMMAPIIAELAKEYAGILKVKFIDVWKKKNVELAKEYKINSIPTQLFLDKNGKELWRHAGFISKEDIMKKWKSLGYDFEKLKKDKPAVEKAE